MKKLLSKLKDKKIYLINALLVIFIFLISLFLKQVYPFGDTLFPECDAHYQYQPMLYNFIEKLRTGTLESYTFNLGFGAPTTFNYIYYLSSPLNYLCIFIKSPENMFLFSVLLRLVLTSITITFYTRKKINNNFISTICSIGYCFSSWFIAYYDFNIWLDIFMIFPIFQYSLEQLINNNKAKLYIFTLAFILLSNFYLAFMCCLYALIYYIFNIIIKKDKYINKIKNFQLIMFSTIISCLLIFIHLYMIYDTFIKMGILLNGTSNLFDLSIKSFIASLFCGNTNFLITNTGESFPNIGMSSIFIMSLIYYLFNKDIPLKKKIKFILITTFIILITFSKTADYIINAFHVPTGFTYRYAFIICFGIMYIFIKNYQTFKNKIDKKIYIINLIILITIIILYKLDAIKLNVLFLNIGFILSYSIFFIFYKNNKYYKYILILLIVIESICSYTFNIRSIVLKDYEVKDFETKEYRMAGVLTETKEPAITNLLLYSNDNYLNSFTTMNYKKILEILYLLDVGTDGGNHITIYNPSNVFNMFFNIKNDNYYLEKIFAVNKEFKDYKLSNEEVTFNNMIEYATGYKDTLIELEQTKIDDNKIHIYIKEDGYYRVNFLELCSFDFKTEDKSTNVIKYGVESIPTTIYLPKNSVLIVTDFIKDSKPVAVYKENEEILKKAHQKLSQNQINYTSYSDSYMEGTITVDKNQVIYTSIPYDKDWEVTIDGKKVNTFKILHEFIGFDCKEGNHTITLKYKPHYEIPLLISITTLISLIIHSIIKRKKVTNHV